MKRRATSSSPLGARFAVGLVVCCRRRLSLLLVLSPAAFSTPSAADQDATSAPAPASRSDFAAGHRKHGVFGSLGAFSAVGFVGLSYSYAPSEPWAIEAGLGYGLSGVQLSLLPKWSLGHRDRLVVGVGPSMGLMLDDASASLWVNGDIGYEMRTDNGFSVAMVAGFTQGIAGCIAKKCRPGGGDWGDDSSSRALISERAADYGSPQGRIIIGKWF